MVSSGASSAIAKMTKLAIDKAQLQCTKGLGLNTKLSFFQDKNIFVEHIDYIWSSSTKLGTNI